MSTKYCLEKAPYRPCGLSWNTNIVLLDHLIAYVILFVLIFSLNYLSIEQLTILIPIIIYPIYSVGRTYIKLMQLLKLHGKPDGTFKQLNPPELQSEWATNILWIIMSILAFKKQYKILSIVFIFLIIMHSIESTYECLYATFIGNANDLMIAFSVSYILSINFKNVSQFYNALISVLVVIFSLIFRTVLGSKTIGSYCI